MWPDNMTDGRLWLETQGTFKVIKNKGSGSCLFRSICQAFSHDEDDHMKIRFKVVKHLINHSLLRNLLNKQGFLRYWWARRMASGVTTPKRKDMRVQSVLKFYLETMTKDEEFGTKFELWAAADLYKCNFEFVTETENGCFQVASCGGYCRVMSSMPRFLFLFSKQHPGHWEWLQPLYFV